MKEQQLHNASNVDGPIEASGYGIFCSLSVLFDILGDLGFSERVWNGTVIEGLLQWDIRCADLFESIALDDVCFSCAPERP